MERGASIGLGPLFTFSRSDVVLGAGTRARISWSLDRALLTKARSVKSPGLLGLVEIDFGRFAQRCGHWALMVMMPWAAPVQVSQAAFDIANTHLWSHGGSFPLTVRMADKRTAIL